MACSREGRSLPVMRSKSWGGRSKQLQAELLERDRAGEEIPLGALAPEPPQELRLLQGLHAFGYDVDPEALSQHEDALDDLDLALVVSHGAHEGTVDLEGVDGQLVQVAERRIPGPEVVDAQAHARGPQVRERRSCRRTVSDQHALRQLEAKSRRLDPAARDHLLQLGAELRLEQLPAGEVHRERDVPG